VAIAGSRASRGFFCTSGFYHGCFDVCLSKG
jgi:hypothetical protein